MQKINTIQEKNIKRVPLLIKMFEKLQGEREGNVKKQPKIQNLNTPPKRATNFEPQLELKTDLEPSQKIIVVNPPSEKFQPTITKVKKRSSKNSIKNYFLSSNLATNRNPDVTKQTTNQKPVKWSHDEIREDQVANKGKEAEIFGLVSSQ